MRFFAAAACLAALTSTGASHTVYGARLTPLSEPEQAQAACLSGTALSGVIRDATDAIIPGARIQIDEAQPVAAGSDGRYRISCVHNGKHLLHATAESFATLDLSFTSPHSSELNITLQPGAIETVVNVAEDSPEVPLTSPTASGPSQTITSKQLSSLADDPDDLLRELQQLSAAAGGSPSSATVAIDGFDNGEGTTHLPPKSSIAYIKINPDLFSAEYRNPPFGGGRIEVYTKPGQSAFHGALFATNSSSWMNARDPFSTAGVALGKQRYGFELTGPIRKQGSDFFTSLEHRTIDNDAVVNAIGINAAGVQTPILQTVAAPQHLWVGNAKVDWQLGPKNTFIASVDSFNNDLKNNGVGGVFLVENGYEVHRYDYNIHLTNVTTISSKIMHEIRLGAELDGYTDAPNSLAPQVAVAGAFTAGGGAQGNAHEHEMWLSPIDDVIIQTKNHLLKIGVQPEIVRITAYLPTNFNGIYTFGGGTTSTGQTLTGVQQYVNALHGAPNGSPTNFVNMTGDPEDDVFQIRGAAFFQDDWKALSNLHIAYGLRYYGQEHPTFGAELQPRLGIAWSPDKKATWSLHAHAGMFGGRLGGHNWQTLRLYDGTDRTLNTVYTPTCPGTFDADTCKPLTTGTVINTVRAIQPSIPVPFWAAENIGLTKSLPKGFTISADYHLAQLWHDSHSENINSPTNGSPTGPRPYAASLNILQLQDNGRGYGNVIFLGVGNQALKQVQFFMGAVREDIIDDTDDSPFYTPQASGINKGEFARRDTDALWQIFGNATAHLPVKLQLSANFSASGMQAFNVTTGFDNNGDGDFNDRPQYASAGTPLCSINTNASPCGYNTPWGELVTSGGTQSLSRDKGNMPWTFFLDTNLQRTFALTKNPKAEHPQTLVFNIRSSNVLNHLNATAVGTVLGSPNFGIPYAAEPGRRIETGLRYAF